MNKRTSTLALAAAGILTLGTALAGCSAIDEIAYKQKSEMFDTAAALAESGVNAPWVPADASGIRVTRTTVSGAGDASVLVDSEADLDPALCTEVDRQSAPVYDVEGAPNALKADTVFACGAWSVMPADGGWYGWAPNHPDEAAQAARP